MNYFKLQQQIINGTFEGVEEEEEVKVNQRHLIDKILARYSAEFTTFRELMQNTNDSEGETAEIIFISEEGKVTQIEYKNNGKIFSSQDWNRLRKISEGNPDESKIGFFGVGFYSLFSLCEEPFVCSGSEFMGFFWKGDQLYTKVGKLPSPTEVSNNGNRWTSFIMSLRETMAFPDTTTFSEFLAKSILFTTSLKTINVYFDTKQVISISKILAPLTSHKINYITSQQSFFSTNLINVQPVQMNISYYPVKKSIKASLLSAFWGTSMDNSNLDFEKEYKSTNFYRISYSVLKSNLSNAFVKHYNRMTKKSPPLNPKIYVIYSNYGEAQGTDIKPTDGQIFIGFPTYQTTGCQAHVYSQFIPTVEREQLDFVDSHLRDWNLELLNTSGQLLRCCYEIELKSLCESYLPKQFPSAVQGQDYESFLDSFAYLINQFSFKTSTPSPILAKALEQAFYSNLLEFPILSTHGYKLIKECRILSRNDLINLINCVPALFTVIQTKCPIFYSLLQTHNCIQDYTVNDLVLQCKSNAFELPRDTVKWNELVYWLKGNPQYKFGQYISVVFDNKSYSFASLTHYASPSEIFPEFPLPSHCVSLSLLSKLNVDPNVFQMQKYELHEFSRFIYTQNLTIDQYKRLLINFNQSLASLTSMEQNHLLHVLNSYKCIPTQHGLQYPCDAYVSTILFKDLPIIDVKCSSQFETFLQLKDKIELQLLFDRLHLLNWDFKQLITYLSDQTFQNHDISKLQQLCIYPTIDHKNQLITNIYPNIPQFNQLDVPLLDYKWSNYKKECRFLIKLGINTSIPIETIVANIVNNPSSKWLDYYLDHSQQYTIPNSVNFIPAMDKDNKMVLGNFTNTFSDKSTLWLPNALYFSDSRLKLDPPSVTFLIESLQKTTVENAKECLLYASTIPIPSRYINQMRDISFIPYKTILLRPNQIYLNSNDSEFSDLFYFCDFDDDINNWLRQLLVRDMPTPKDICHLLPLENMDHNLRFLVYLSKFPFNKDMYLVSNKLLGIQNDKLIICSTKEVVLNDDQSLVNIFNPILCPLDSLNTFYSSLGVPWISESVSKDYQLIGNPKSTILSQELKRLLQQRLDLLLFDIKNKRDNSINTNCQTELENLEFRQIDSITITTMYKSIKDSRQTSCFYNRSLFVSDPIDLYEFAKEISKIIYNRASMNQYLLIHTLLTIPLEDLEKRGYPIKKLIPEPVNRPLPQVEQVDKQVEQVDQQVEPPTKTANAIESTIKPPNRKESLNNTLDTLGSMERFNQSSNSKLNEMIRKTPFGVDTLRNFFNKPSEHSKSTANQMTRRNEADLKNQLQQSIKSTIKDNPMAIKDVPRVEKTMMTTCHIDSGLDLKKCGKYEDYSLYIDSTNPIDLNDKTMELQEFASLLDILSTIYECSRDKINIYYDKNATNIAFNRNKNLFFNLVVFENLHLGIQLIHSLSYWYMIFAHELAHNFVNEHNESHEHYMAAYASTYLVHFVNYFQ